MTSGPKRQLSWWQGREKRPLSHLSLPPGPQYPLLTEEPWVPSLPKAGGLAAQPLVRPAFWNLAAQGILGLWLPSLPPRNPVDSAPLE